MAPIGTNAVLIFSMAPSNNAACSRGWMKDGAATSGAGTALVRWLEFCTEERLSQSRRCVKASRSDGSCKLHAPRLDRALGKLAPRANSTSTTRQLTVETWFRRSPLASCTPDRLVFESRVPDGRVSTLAWCLRTRTRNTMCAVQAHPRRRS